MGSLIQVNRKKPLVAFSNVIFGMDKFEVNEKGTAEITAEVVSERLSPLNEDGAEVKAVKLSIKTLVKITKADIRI